MGYLAGWQRYLHLMPEEHWGEYDPTAPAHYLPFLLYDVAPRVVGPSADPFTGLRTQTLVRATRAHLAGRLTVPLFSHYQTGSLSARPLLEWLFSNPDSVDLQSQTGELVEPGLGAVHHLGLRPALGRLGGSVGEEMLRLQLDLLGRREAIAESPSPLAGPPPRPRAFGFQGVRFRLSGEEVPLQAFDLRVDNHLTVHHVGDYWPSVVAAGERETTLRFVLLKATQVIDGLRRSPEEERSGELELRGVHGGTGPEGTGFVSVTFTFPRLAFRIATEGATRQSLAQQSVEFLALHEPAIGAEVALEFAVE